MRKAKFEVFAVTYRANKEVSFEEEVNAFLEHIEGEIVDVKMEVVVDNCSEPYRADIDLFVVVIYEEKKGGKDGSKKVWD